MVRSLPRLGPAPALFATVCLAAVSTIIFVHHNQKSEKEVRYDAMMVSLIAFYSSVVAVVGL